MAVRIEKIIATVLDEAHKRQVEEVIDTLQEGSEGFYKCYLDISHWLLYFRIVRVPLHLE